MLSNHRFIRSIIPFFGLLFFISGQRLLAQDKLILMNGNEVDVFVVKVERDYVLSKSTNPKDEHVYKYPKAEVVRIEYADGRVEHCEDPPKAEEESPAEFVKVKPPVITNDSMLRSKPLRRKERLFYIGLGTGLNIPLGRYASSDGADHGYARLGSFLTFESSILFSRSIGLSLSLGYANNGIRNTAVEQKWELPTVPDYKFSVNSYNHTYLLLGPFMTIRTDQKLYVDLKMKWGFSFTPEPTYHFEYMDSAGRLTKIDNINDSLNSSELIVSPLSIDLGFALRYNFNKRFGMVLQYDWMIIPMFYTSTQRIRVFAGGSVVSEEERKMDVYELASFNNIGLGFYFMIVGPDR